MSEDIKVGDRVRVDGAIPGTPYQAHDELGTVKALEDYVAVVAFDSGATWDVYEEQVTKAEGDSEPPSGDIKVGSRVRGVLSGRTGRVAGVGMTDGNFHVEWDSGITPGRNVEPGHLERIDPDPSAPLAILARAAEEVLTYHVGVEADDDEGIECWGVDGGWLTVGNLRGLVRQGKREGVL